MKTHMIISIDTGKTYDKIQHPSLIKTLRKTGIQENFLNLLIKTYTHTHTHTHTQPTIYLTVKDWNGNKVMMSILTTLIQHTSLSFHRHNKEKEIKGIQIRKEEIEMFLCDDILKAFYVKSLKKHTKSLITNKWVQYRGHNKDRQKLTAFLYTSTERVNTKIKNITKITQKKKKRNT